MVNNKKNLKTITDDKEYSGSTINDIIVEKIYPYIGKSLEELKIELGVTYSKGQNGYLVKKILGLDKKEESFEDANPWKNNP